MKINSISIKNIGSYKDEHIFNTETTKDKNIVLIGGKNGTGKTTLFNSVRVCLYGYMSMGYKSKNFYYYKAISQLINDSAKLSKPNEASVSINLSLIEGNEENKYRLDRKWNISDDIVENFRVQKNGIYLTENEVADFEKYIINLIPPELFNLYFFDGEKIADFFMNEDSQKNIKNAFLTLCGYDTFDIMKRNFKRVSLKDNNADALFNEYLYAKQELKDVIDKYENLKKDLEYCKNDLFDCDSIFEKNEEEYTKIGGISEKEWDKKLDEIRKEESKRANWHQEIKVLSNEKIPFVIISDLLDELKNQISEENKLQKKIAFNELISDEGLNKELTKKTGENSELIIEVIKDYINKQNKSDTKMILNLSEDQNAELLATIYEIKKFDSNRIYEIKKSLEESKEKVSGIRQELDKSDRKATSVYLKRKTDILEQKNNLLTKKSEIEPEISEVEKELIVKQKAFEKKEKEVKSSLKSQSISDISAKSIIMLEQLENVLYHNQINKIENNFKNIINGLTHKKRFIDDIYIDDDFGIHIYKEQVLELEKIYNVLNESGMEGIEKIFGRKVIEYIRKEFNSNNENELLKILDSHKDVKVKVPVEINKNVLSSGEKQVFIMALYYSMVTLNNKNLPFIIDTPFARIDMENRINLTKNFFRGLKGQVFILSTDKEIEDKHKAILEDKLAVTYSLRNDKNNGTVIYKDKYFEVKHDI